MLHQGHQRRGIHRCGNGPRTRYPYTNAKPLNTAWRSPHSCVLVSYYPARYGRWRSRNGEEAMALTITTQSGDVLTASADALIVPVWARVRPCRRGGSAGSIRGGLAGGARGKGFTGKRGDIAAFPTFGRLPARTLVLTGLGERASEPGPRGEALRRAYGAAIKRARDEGAQAVAAAVPAGADADEVGAAVEGISLALYRFTRYKTRTATRPRRSSRSNSGAGRDPAARSSTGRRSRRASPWRAIWSTRSAMTRRRRRSPSGRSGSPARPDWPTDVLDGAPSRRAATTASWRSARGARRRPG